MSSLHLKRISAKQNLLLGSKVDNKSSNGDHRVMTPGGIALHRTMKDQDLAAEYGLLTLRTTKEAKNVEGPLCLHLLQPKLCPAKIKIPQDCKIKEVLQNQFMIPKLKTQAESMEVDSVRNKEMEYKNPMNQPQIENKTENSINISLEKTTSNRTQELKFNTGSVLLNTPAEIRMDGSHTDNYNEVKVKKSNSNSKPEVMENGTKTGNIPNVGTVCNQDDSTTFTPSVAKNSNKVLKIGKMQTGGTNAQHSSKSKERTSKIPFSPCAMQKSLDLSSNSNIVVSDDFVEGTESKIKENDQKSLNSVLNINVDNDSIPIQHYDDTVSNLNETKLVGDLVEDSENNNLFISGARSPKLTKTKNQDGNEVDLSNNITTEFEIKNQFKILQSELTDVTKLKKFTNELQVFRVAVPSTTSTSISDSGSTPLTQTTDGSTATTSELSKPTTKTLTSQLPTISTATTSTLSSEQPFTNSTSYPSASTSSPSKTTGYQPMYSSDYNYSYSRGRGTVQSRQGPGNHKINRDGVCCQDTPVITTNKAGVICFRLPGRIEHKTTIKVAHYPQQRDDNTTCCKSVTPEETSQAEPNNDNDNHLTYTTNPNSLRYQNNYPNTYPTNSNSINYNNYSSPTHQNSLSYNNRYPPNSSNPNSVNYNYSTPAHQNYVSYNRYPNFYPNHGSVNYNNNQYQNSPEYPVNSGYMQPNKTQMRSNMTVSRGFNDYNPNRNMGHPLSF